MPKISDPRILLEVTNLHVEFNTENGKVRAVDGINFTLNEGEILGIVGESGCGKSTTAHSILNLIAPEDGKITNGEIIFNSQNLLQLSQKEIDLQLRISQEFQEAEGELKERFEEQVADIKETLVKANIPTASH